MTYRVHYSLHAAGGRLWPTYRDVQAPGPLEALQVAESQERQSAAEERVSYRGYFTGATAHPVRPSSLTVLAEAHDQADSVEARRRRGEYAVDTPNGPRSFDGPEDFEDWASQWDDDPNPYHGDYSEE